MLFTHTLSNNNSRAYFLRNFDYGGLLLVLLTYQNYDFLLDNKHFIVMDYNFVIFAAYVIHISTYT